MLTLTETTTTRSKIILLSASSNSDWGCSPEFCALTLTEELVQKVRTAKRLLIENPPLNIQAIDMWDDYSGEFFSDDNRAAVTDEQATALRHRTQEGVEYVLLADGFTAPEADSNRYWWDGGDGVIYCDARAVVVTESGFYLKYSPKHSEGTDFDSGEVSWDTLDTLFP